MLVVFVAGNSLDFPRTARKKRSVATSACTAYLDCYGGDDRKAVKVHSYADDDDFFDDDLYAALS